MLTYLATPYSHPLTEIREARFQAAAFVAGELMKTGKFIYSPIAHSHSIALATDMPTGWDFWEKQDMVMLDRSSELIVLMLPGWDTSTGVNAETVEARRLGLPVVHLPYHSFGLGMELKRTLRDANKLLVKP